MSRHLLVIVNAAIPTSALDALAYSRGRGKAEMLVVTPSRLSPDTPVASVPVHAVSAPPGDSDPLSAIENALRTFPADEILVVNRPGGEAGWLESGSGAAARERFNVPVTHVVVADSDWLANAS